MIAYGADHLNIDVAEIDARIADNWSMPTRFYWDPAIFDFEMETIFSKNWLYFGPLHNVAEPGDVAVRQMGKYPIVVTRDRDGELHAFLNVCRHRGYTVVEGDRSKCLRLVCRYHGWSYNLDGTLANAPDADGEAGFCQSDLALRPVAVEQMGPAILVNPDPTARPFRACHPAFAENFENLGFCPDPDRYVMRKEITYDIGTNWKLWYDNGTECYHCPNIHGESFGAAFRSAPEDTEAIYGDGFMTNNWKPQPEVASNQLTSRTFRSYQVFPGIVLIEHDDLLHMSGMVPVAPGVTQHVTHYLGDRDSDPERIDAWIDLWDQTYREDNEITAVQYDNIETARQPYNRYVHAREEAAKHFNAITWQHYKEALLG